MTVPVYALGDLVPDIDPEAYVHPDAVVIGAVTLGAETSMWPGSILHAGYGLIVVGEWTSIRDGTVLLTTEDWPTVIGNDCVVGANALVTGDTDILEGSMALGVPARIRPVDPDEQQKWIDFAVSEYRESPKRYRDSLRLIRQGAQ